MYAQTVMEPTQLHQGVAAARAGEIRTARFLLTQLVEQQPEHELAWLWLAHLAPDADQAIRCWQRVLMIKPQQPDAQAGLKRLLLPAAVAAARLGNRAHARELLQLASEVEPGNQMIWMWRAALAETQIAALDYVTSILTLNPDHSSALAWLLKQRPSATQCPLCYAEKDEVGSGCTTCGAVLTLAEPDSLRDNKSADPGILSRALVRLKALAAHTQDADIRYYLGLTLLNLKRQSEGLAYLQEAARLRPADESLRQQIARLSGRSPQADHTAVQSSPQTVALTSNRVVLVVDDSPTIRRLVALTLEKHGYQVQVAPGGAEALEMLHQLIPALILLDITMPQMDGYQLCRLIKDNDRLNQVPVVMLSGKDGLFDKARGRMAGAQEFITKPFDPSQLVQMVNGFCGAQA